MGSSGPVDCFKQLRGALSLGYLRMRCFREGRERGRHIGCPPQSFIDTSSMSWEFHLRELKHEIVGRECRERDRHLFAVHESFTDSISRKYYLRVLKNELALVLSTTLGYKIELALVVSTTSGYLRISLH